LDCSATILGSRYVKVIEYNTPQWILEKTEMTDCNPSQTLMEARL
jgi:hypothetical protein